MKKNLLVTLILTAVGFFGCNKANETGDGSTPGNCFPAKPDCTGIVCTAQFVGITVIVKDAGGAVVALDSFVVTDLTGNPLPPSSAGVPVYGYPQSGDGTYCVINDAWVNQHRNSTSSVRAKGFINGVQVFDEPYTITADCCHVGKVSGKDAVIIP